MLIQTALLFVALLAAFPADGAAAGKPKHRKTPRRVHREAPIDPAVVNNAALAEPVRPGASGSAILRAQVLLARAHFSCGEIDARYGANLKIAIEDYQSSHGLPAGGIVEEQTWKLLNTDSNPALVRAPIAPEDVAGPFSPVPEEMMEKAKLPALNYSSPLEAIAEKYHASPALLQKLNPGAAFDRAGEEIVAPNVLSSPPEKAASIVVSKSRRAVLTLDSAGRILSRYPATIAANTTRFRSENGRSSGSRRTLRFTTIRTCSGTPRVPTRKRRSSRGPTTPSAWPGSTCPRSTTAFTELRNLRRSARLSRMAASA